MERKMSWAVIGVLSLLIVGIVLYTYSFPKTIHVVQQAVVFANDSKTDWKTTTVTIEGTFYRPLFKDNTFEGTFRIEDFPFTYAQQNFSLFLLEHTKALNTATMSYVNFPSNSQGTIDMYTGQIYFADNFESFNIIANEKWFGATDNQVYYIVSGSTLEDARLVQQSQAEKMGTELMLAKVFRN